jgi:hypothetical protein
MIKIGISGFILEAQARRLRQRLRHELDVRASEVLAPALDARTRRSRQRGDVKILRNMIANKQLKGKALEKANEAIETADSAIQKIADIMKTVERSKKNYKNGG